jgi:formylmethanofuran dehydrogenase subunit D
VIIQYEDGTIIYQGAITDGNKTAFSYNKGVGDYSILIKDAESLTTPQIMEVSSTINATTLYGSVTVQGNLTTVNVPGTVTYLPQNAFNNNPLIREIVLSEGVVGTLSGGGSKGIQNCKGLRKVSFPKSFISVANLINGNNITSYSFMLGCPNIEEYVYPDGWEIPVGFCYRGDMSKNMMVSLFNKAGDISGKVPRTIGITERMLGLLLADDISILTDKNYTIVVVGE